MMAKLIFDQLTPALTYDQIFRMTFQTGSLHSKKQAIDFLSHSYSLYLTWNQATLGFEQYQRAVGPVLAKLTSTIELIKRDVLRLDTLQLETLNTNFLEFFSENTSARVIFQTATSFSKSMVEIQPEFYQLTNQVCEMYKAFQTIVVENQPDSKAGIYYSGRISDAALTIFNAWIQQFKGRIPTPTNLLKEEWSNLLVPSISTYFASERRRIHEERNSTKSGGAERSVLSSPSLESLLIADPIIDTSQSILQAPLHQSPNMQFMYQPYDPRSSGANGMQLPQYPPLQQSHAPVNQRSLRDMQDIQQLQLFEGNSQQMNGLMHIEIQERQKTETQHSKQQNWAPQQKAARTNSQEFLAVTQNPISQHNEHFLQFQPNPTEVPNHPTHVDGRFLSVPPPVAVGYEATVEFLKTLPQAARESLFDRFKSEKSDAYDMVPKNAINAGGLQLGMDTGHESLLLTRSLELLASGYVPTSLELAESERNKPSIQTKPVATTQRVKSKVVAEKKKPLPPSHVKKTRRRTKKAPLVVEELPMFSMVEKAATSHEDSGGQLLPIAFPDGIKKVIANITQNLTVAKNPMDRQCKDVFEQPQIIQDGTRVGAGESPKPVTSTDSQTITVYTSLEVRSSAIDTVLESEIIKPVPDLEKAEIALVIAPQFSDLNDAPVKKGKNIRLIESPPDTQTPEPKIARIVSPINLSDISSPNFVISKGRRSSTRSTKKISTRTSTRNFNRAAQFTPRATRSASKVNGLAKLESSTHSPYQNMDFAFLEMTRPQHNSIVPLKVNVDSSTLSISIIDKDGSSINDGIALEPSVESPLPVRESSIPDAFKLEDALARNVDAEEQVRAPEDARARRISRKRSNFRTSANHRSEISLKRQTVGDRNSNPKRSRRNSKFVEPEQAPAHYFEASLRDDSEQVDFVSPLLTNIEDSNVCIVREKELPSFEDETISEDEDYQFCDKEADGFLTVERAFLGDRGADGPLTMDEKNIPASPQYTKVRSLPVDANKIKITAAKSSNDLDPMDYCVVKKTPDVPEDPYAAFAAMLQMDDYF